MIGQHRTKINFIKSYIYADKFCKDDLEELYSTNFTDKDFYELLSYATNFMAKSKMIEVYIK